MWIFCNICPPAEISVGPTEDAIVDPSEDSVLGPIILDNIIHPKNNIDVGPTAEYLYLLVY